MKKGLKWMAGLLTLAMVVGSFAGCGSSSSKETAAAGESAAATTAEYAAQPKCQRCFQPHWGVQYRQQDVLRPEESGYCAKRRGF